LAKQKSWKSLGEHRVFSCDHVAINDKVTAYDVKSAPLPDESLDIAVFSLYLMGKNWPDYILEVILIARMYILRTNA
jgi:Hypothetical methyltransferase